MRVAAALLTLFLAVPATAADLEATPYIEKVFTQGERIEFTLSWLGIVGGKAVMTVKPEPDRFTIHTLAVSEGAIGRMYPVRDEIESVVSRSDFSTIHFSKRLRERGREKNRETFFDREKKIATYRDREISYEPPVFDPMSSVYYIRTLDLSPGKTHAITLVADAKIYEMEAEVLRRETLDVQGSQFRTVLVEPKMREGGIFRDSNNRLLIWYTDDERRIPIRIRSELEFGSITATIRSARLLNGGGEAAGNRKSQ